jgi:hypothetical protein
MHPLPNLGGVFAPVDSSLTLNRVGYGAIQLTGPIAWGSPKDRSAAVAVVREAVRLGKPNPVSLPLSPRESKSYSIHRFLVKTR